MTEQHVTSPPLSIVVVAYNMRREIPRTLESLSPRYQQGILKTQYEVLLVDNGSDQPFQESDFSGLDLNLRCLRNPNPKVSPVGAINLGLQAARGSSIAVWIDGARMASPGLLASACEALRISPRAVVGARGRYLGPGVQSETMRRGHTREVEDRLLQQSGWRDDGYRLFGISVFDESSGPTWFDQPTESNSLFLSRELWSELGGYDVRFDSVGGGLVNLDIWSRALALPGVTPVVLLGEATFHQFHGGTMTNAADQLERWRELCEEYQLIRGHPWVWPSAPLRWWGRFSHAPPPQELICRFRRWRRLSQKLQRTFWRVARAVGLRK
jgi:glycosyltransferase involved in cell wall biosynthesis